MHMLKSYLDDMIINGDLTKSDIDRAKKEQETILSEVGRVKKDLDTFIHTRFKNK